MRLELSPPPLLGRGTLPHHGVEWVANGLPTDTGRSRRDCPTPGGQRRGGEYGGLLCPGRLHSSHVQSGSLLWGGGEGGGCYINAFALMFVLAGLEGRMTAMMTATVDSDTDAAESVPPAIPSLRPVVWHPLEDRLSLEPPLPPLLWILRDVSLSSLLSSFPLPPTATLSLSLSFLVPDASGMWRLSYTVSPQ